MADYKDFLSNSEQYFSQAMLKAKRYIECGIWLGIDKSNLHVWGENFKSPEGKLLAAILLEEFVYKSEAQIKALIEHALISSIPRCFSSNTIEILSDVSGFQSLRNKRGSSEEFRFVPVIRDDDPPTKSGPLVARLYKRLGLVNERNMIWPWKISDAYEEGIKKFVLIDDTLATGEQFCGFCDRFIRDLPVDIVVGYVPLVAHEKGIRLIEEKYSRVNVSPVESFKDGMGFFDRKVSIIGNGNLKQLYDFVVVDFFNKRFYEKQRYGYGELAMTLGYYHSTPNATLPVFWYDDKKFNPLVKR